MKKNLLYLLAMLFIFAGCSEADPEPEKTYLLQSKKSVVTFPSGGGLMIDLNYRYNELNQIVAIDGVLVRDGETKTGTTTLEYDSQGRVVFVKNWLGTTWTNTYNENGQLENVVRKYESSEPYHHLHIYNNNNQLVEVKTYKNEVSTDAFIGSRFYTYDSGNIIKIRSVLASGKEDNRVYTLITDDKKRELPILPHQITLNFYAAEVFAEHLLTQHNIVSNEVINNVQGNKMGVSYNATYTYNKSGYPLTAVKTFEEGSVEKITYDYKEIVK